VGPVMNLQIRELVGSNCITLEDGQVVYEKIYPELKAQFGKQGPMLTHDSLKRSQLKKVRGAGTRSHVITRRRLGVQYVGGNDETHS
jgi:hypothetical protein